jgi:hypothetical protein
LAVHGPVDLLIWLNSPSPVRPKAPQLSRLLASDPTHS